MTHPKRIISVLHEFVLGQSDEGAGILALLPLLHVESGGFLIAIGQELHLLHRDLFLLFSHLSTSERGAYGYVVGAG